MSEMKTLTINGVQYTAKDGNAVRFNEAQERTGEEKSRARANIGVKDPLIVTIENEYASVIPNAMYAHVQSGGTVVLLHDTYLMPLLRTDGGTAIFGYVEGEEHLVVTCTVYDDGYTELFERVFATSDLVVAQSKPIYVTVDHYTDNASLTAGQIWEHTNNGRTVMLQAYEGENIRIALSSSWPEQAFFFEPTDEINTVYVHYIDEAAGYRRLEVNIATLDLLQKKITVPNTAEVGQTIVVKSVDSNGKPTAWEAADLPSGGSSTLVVSVYQDGRVSHTSAEIYAHVQSGGSVILVDNEQYYMLMRSTPDTVWFGYISDDGFAYCIYFYGAGNRIERYEHAILTYQTIENMIDTKLGTTFDDIDTLLGGDS